MIFRQLFDTTSSTYTYLLADEVHRQALLIDPVFDQVGRDLALIDELGLKLMLAVDTHAHADHVTAAWLLKPKNGSKIASAKIRGEEHVDLPHEHGTGLGVERVLMRPIATPGSTGGGLSYLLADRK